MHDGRLLSCVNFSIRVHFEYLPKVVPCEHRLSWHRVLSVRTTCLSLPVLQLEIALSGVALRFPDVIGTPTMELGLYVFVLHTGR